MNTIIAVLFLAAVVVAAPNGYGQSYGGYGQQSYGGYGQQQSYGYTQSYQPTYNQGGSYGGSYGGNNYYQQPIILGYQGYSSGYSSGGYGGY